jgi:hypothetical protein
MHINQLHPGQLRRGGNCPCDSVGNVVEFQIEENVKAEARELFNRPRAFGRKELQPNLKQARRTAKPPR